MIADALREDSFSLSQKEYVPTDEGKQEDDDETATKSLEDEDGIDDDAHSKLKEALRSVLRVRTNVNNVGQIVRASAGQGHCQTVDRTISS